MPASGASLPAEAYTDEALDIFPGRFNDPDPRIEILDPLDRQLEDTVTLALALEQQFRIEEPGLILDLRQQFLDCPSRCTLEAALRITEPVPEQQANHRIVSARDNLSL